MPKDLILPSGHRRHELSSFVCEVGAGATNLNKGPVREADQPRRPTDALPELVEKYLRNLRSVVSKEPDRARGILQKLIGEVTLEPNNQGLEAVLRGNVSGILNLEERYCTTGAGRGI